jgi:hypothetical protein
MDNLTERGDSKMNCSNCGAKNVENFCGECGAAQNTSQPGYGNGEPVVFADTVATPPVKRKSNVLNILVSVVLALFTLGGVGYGVTSHGEVELRQALIVEALQEVQDFTELAEGYEDIYAESVIERDRCYINWYCSAASYREWIDLVNEAETLGISARQDVSTWEERVLAETQYRTEAEQNRTIGFALAGLFGVGLIVFIVLMIVRKGKRS